VGAALRDHPLLNARVTETDVELLAEINVAVAVEPSAVKRNANEIGSLGVFGASHIDCRDCPAAPTGMTVLSEDDDSVEPELFFIFDLGLAWRLESLSTYYFSGLHVHCGSQPVYKPDRANKDNIHYRLTLIAYPPDDMLTARDAVSLAGLPNGKLLQVGYDFRDA